MLSLVKRSVIKPIVMIFSVQPTCLFLSSSHAILNLAGRISLPLCLVSEWCLVWVGMYGVSFHSSSTELFGKRRLGGLRLINRHNHHRSGALNHQRRSLGITLTNFQSWILQHHRMGGYLLDSRYILKFLVSPTSNFASEAEHERRQN